MFPEPQCIFCVKNSVSIAPGFLTVCDGPSMSSACDHLTPTNETYDRGARKKWEKFRLNLPMGQLQRTTRAADDSGRRHTAMMKHLRIPSNRCISSCNTRPRRFFLEILFQSKLQFRAPTGRDSSKSDGAPLSTLQYCRVNTVMLVILQFAYRAKRAHSSVWTGCLGRPTGGDRIGRSLMEGDRQPPPPRRLE